MSPRSPSVVQLALVSSVAIAALVTAPPADALSDTDVVRVMSSRRTDIRKACWESRPDRPETSMRVDFVVAARGVVTDATASDVHGPPEVVACVLAEVRRTTFPATPAGGRFHWPFIFKGP